VEKHYICNTMNNTEIRLSDGRIVAKSQYIILKTKALVEFGYSSLRDIDVANELEKIVAGRNDLTVIGLFCKDDISENQTI